MPEPLAETPRRVVGVLIEKVLATPQYYPMTLNALVAGCNQKSNRSPVLALDEDEVRRALVALMQQGLVASFRMEGARAEKWKTRAREAYDLASEKHMAVLAEMLLRGPQTKGKLRGNASRMRHAIEPAELDAILDELASRDDPLVANIGRTPGGRADLWAHTLYPEKEMAAVRAGASPAPARAPTPPVADARLDEAFREIRDLEARVASLEALVADLTRDGPPRPGA